MQVITRFAPSPTGYLHIGGARTALFNYLFAKHHGGTFLLRIEDTDRARSTQGAIDAILDGMRWLGLDWEGEPIYQFARLSRHAEVAQELLKRGAAFKCYTSAEELDAFRKENPNAKFRSPWRDKEGPAGAPFVIRLKAPLTGETVVEDAVQGRVEVKNAELDDMVLLRSDGTPTYMLAVVVDDHDMHITHIIRGDDHFTNSFRQRQIYDAMGWTAPAFAHVPMILGPDGAKLSKRHGAQAVGDYREMGYLPEAVRNYLLRLGWSHGDDEIISDAQAIAWFTLDTIGKSPSRFDFTKLENLNGHYIREAEDGRLAELILPALGEVTPLGKQRLIKGMPGLKTRTKTLRELAENGKFYVTSDAPPLEEKAKAALENGGKALLHILLPVLEAQSDWSHSALEHMARSFAEAQGKKLGDVAQALRAALTGRTTSPGMFEVMEVLGKDETVKRIKDRE